MSADSQGLCPPTVKNYVRPLSRITSAYSQGLCPPTVKDYVRLQSGTVSAYSQGLCPLTVRDCVRLLPDFPTPPWTLHSLVLSAVVIHVVITAGLPAYFSTEDVISRGIICTCVDGSLQRFLLRPLGHPPDESPRLFIIIISHHHHTTSFVRGRQPDQTPALW